MDAEKGLGNVADVFEHGPVFDWERVQDVGLEHVTINSILKQLNQRLIRILIIRRFRSVRIQTHDIRMSSKSHKSVTFVDFQVINTAVNALESLYYQRNMA